MAKLIGCSLSLCLREMVRDGIGVENIEFIIANTDYADAAQMEEGLRSVMSPGPATDEKIKIAHILWESGRIYQATVRDTARIRTGPIWAAAPGFFEVRLPHTA